jgi:hypothetical protein
MPAWGKDDRSLFEMATCRKLTLMWDKHEIRGANGGLLSPPRFLTAVHDDSSDEIRVMFVDWDVAHALVPHEASWLTNKLQEWRKKRNEELLARPADVEPLVAKQMGLETSE